MQKMIAIGIIGLIASTVQAETPGQELINAKILVCENNGGKAKIIGNDYVECTPAPAPAHQNQ